MLHNIREYKKAMVYVKDLQKILDIVNAAEISLKNYENYKPVQGILTTIALEKDLIKFFLEQNQMIIETKGATRR